MPRKKSLTKFLKYGYWSYADPLPAIRKALAKTPQLAQEFHEILDNEEDIPTLDKWAAEHRLSATVRNLIRKGLPKGDALRFGEVEVAGGSGPDVGSMTGGGAMLFARRENGWIVYRGNEDCSAPKPTRKPLDIDMVFAAVVCDPDYGYGEFAEEAIAAYLEGERTREAVLEAIDSYAASASMGSDFYDLQSVWNSMMEGVKEAALEEFDEAGTD